LKVIDKLLIDCFNKKIGEESSFCDYQIFGCNLNVLVLEEENYTEFIWFKKLGERKIFESFLGWKIKCSKSIKSEEIKILCFKSTFFY